MNLLGRAVRAVAIDADLLRRRRELRLLMIGQGVSLLGSAVTLVAIPVQMYDLTGSTVAVGLVGAAQFVPILALALLGGALADAFDRRRLMVTAELGSLTVTAALMANALLPDRGLGSMILVPLLAGGEPIGVLTLRNSDPLRRFGEEDLALAEELGRRAGVALLNTRSYVRRTAIMHALQHGLLPPALPDVPGWPAAVTYLPAGELSEVGGDFYDIFRGSGGWMLMVGDVVGQGAEAATLSSLARYTVRAAAELTGDPARAIGHLNSVLREQPGLPLCTVVCANLEELPGGDARLHLASAGHPAPLLVRGEEVTAVGRPGTIAGAFDDDGEWTATEVEMRRGDLLVLYTDGVLDAVGPDDRFGDDRLREALAEIPGAVEERVARLTERLEAFRDGERRDDLTVLMLEYRGAPELSGPQQPAAGQPRR